MNNFYFLGYLDPLIRLFKSSYKKNNKKVSPYKTSSNIRHKFAGADDCRKLEEADLDLSDASKGTIETLNFKRWRCCLATKFK